jgi:hypothetical protein
MAMVGRGTERAVYSSLCLFRSVFRSALSWITHEWDDPERAVRRHSGSVLQSVSQETWRKLRWELCSESSVELALHGFTIMTADNIGRIERDFHVRKERCVSSEATMQVRLLTRSSAVVEVSHIGRTLLCLPPKLIHSTAGQTRVPNLSKRRNKNRISAHFRSLVCVNEVQV